MNKNYFLIFIGGGVGSVLRYFLSVFIPKWFSVANFPVGTLLINVLGSFLMGVFFSVFKENLALKWFFITGICGGFTTFSAFSLENIQLLQNGHYFSAVLYIFLSFSLGFLATFIGICCFR